MDKSARIFRLAGTVGGAGFAFFFLKGIVWLAIFAGAAFGLMGK